MRRRTSLPRLNILATGSAAHEALVPPTPSLARPKTGIPALTVESLVARNREAGAPLSDNPAEADEDFPYQFGPKEILPGLYLGSEQNAKDPMIIRRLGITQVICCAKEVACPWLADEAIQEEASEEHHSMEEESDDTTRADTSGDSHTTYLALPSSSMSGMATPTSRGSRSPSPSRPAFLRPAASTPNLKEGSRSSSPLPHDLSNTMAREADGTEGPRSASMRVASQGHTGYMHRQFSANRRTGRPALSYTKLPWGHDEDNIANHFEDYEICELIDRARRENGRCLVHCQLGVSRSATLMIGYCMRQAFRKEDLSALADIKSMHDSYTYVRAKSRWVAPNIGLLVSMRSASSAR